MVARTDSVSLRVVDKHNVKAVIDLSTSESQTEFVAPNVKSLAEAFAAEYVWVRAIYAAEEPVGFVMVSHDPDKSEYDLWRYMIDERYQGMGFGRSALTMVHDHVRSQPDGNIIYVCYVRAEGGPEGFYKSFGYIDTGEVHWGEHQAKLDL